ncbi:armadillo-like helical domain-containing protein 4 isoform X3 [Desmodus rotundus]|uniref:armadillo-like helical domain-containing protein 4 isoform X3 n=1 Tax=Desmodus rotundus TaxID=9430 RepID=UPI0023818F5B|nr:armadillo-like helical domain-containing protein 4 isoform X3 [Desmodus rotundus]
MRRPIVPRTCLAFCSLLLLHFAAQCLAFPKMEGREATHVNEQGVPSEKIHVDDLENNPITSKGTFQPVVSEGPMIVLAGPSAVTLSKVFSIIKETPSVGAGLMQPSSLGIDTTTEPVVRAGEEAFGSSQTERMHPETLLSKAVVTNPITATASRNTDEKEEPFSSTNIQPIVEGTTETTQGFLKYVDNQLFTTESQGSVSLGYSSSSYVNTNKILTTDPRTEQFEADTDPRTTSFPGAEPVAGTEPGSLTSDREKPLQMTADNTQATATKHGLAISEYALSVKPEADSLLGAPEVTVSVSTAGPAASALSDEWDDTKLESVSQIKTPKLGDNTETRTGMEMSPTAQVTDSGMEGTEGVEGDGPVTEAARAGLGLPEGETHTGTALLTAHGDGRSSAFTDQVSFTPTSPMEGTKASAVNLFPNTADFMESTKESRAVFFSETTVSISEHESEAHQPLRNTFKDTITQEMTTAAQEAEATLSLVTPEQQVSTLQVPREHGETAEGKGSPLATSDVPGVTQLLRRWETLATTVPPTAAPLSFEVTPTVEEGEEDEDEEDEEEEDEEEEDEEEDEEDKDADSLDESLDDDAEPRGFTLPGVTSQEPGLEPENVDLLEGATYQVPDTIEWEQQNQGLALEATGSLSVSMNLPVLDFLFTLEVRSWMEKLKDKAGYMSGMLVPVGVGIAGALFILGALYSLKVMNRRRRNGFKRHKRKQREFNSMQDRVMLLADSSEDEF